jgi:hypothetical protein
MMQLPGKPFQGMGQKISGILQDPNQLAENPLFNMGIGLLDPSTPLTQSIIGGLAQAQAAEQQRKDIERLEQLRKELAALLAKQGGGGPTPMMGPPAPMPPAGSFGPPRPPGM